MNGRRAARDYPTTDDMRMDGWVFRGQFSSWLFYRKGGRRLTLHTPDGSYIIEDVHESAYEPAPPVQD